MLTLLTGGARSGKSALAVALGRRHDGSVTFIATCQPFDDELAGRVAHHRAERPPWPTIEAPEDLAGALAAAGAGLVIIDCLTLWTGNLLYRGDDDDTIVTLASECAEQAAGRADGTVAITNEVGLGVHPETALGRRYRDVLGLVNQRWADVAATTLLVVAGRAVRLDDPGDLLP